MLELVLANLRTRPFRTLISILGVALGVILVVLFTGLARGMSNDMARRAANWKAEILFTRPGAMSISSSSLNVSTTYAERLLEVEGVESTVPVGQHIMSNSDSRWGLEKIDGVEWKPFAEINKMQMVQGRPATANDEIIVDERNFRDNSYKLGDTKEIFGKDYKIVGVFSPPSSSRIKMSLSAMQEALQAERKCTFVLVKLKDGVDADQVASLINDKFPGNKVNLTRDLIIDAEDRIPGFKIFLNVLVGLGAFVSTIFVMLSMYTTITERRKEIGILKSLGASKPYIIKVIEGEAFLIGVLGIILGLAISFLSAFSIQQLFELPFESSTGWLVTAFLIAIGGSLIGALYPAWRASAIDPVEVMVNE